MPPVPTAVSTEGVTPLASVPPVFCTVMLTATSWFTLRKTGDMASVAARTAGRFTVICGLTPKPVAAMAWPLFWSKPEASA